MEASTRISHTSALILQTIRSGYIYGFDIMDVTGLPSGTIYPALRRLENESLVRGDWENSKIALRQDRPPRRYYKLTRQGKDALISAVERYPLLARLAPEEKTVRR
ncbi:MAG: putative transcriptional regulator [Candidatus Angelobacter sp.]|jgi:DNA-binding PadR family transcriptional regulator|nr:putative transcriptional regulator [Candidatus Angelobacter sp.]